MSDFTATGYRRSDYIASGNNAHRLRVSFTARSWPEAARTASKLLKIRGNGEDVLIERLLKRRAKHTQENGRNDTFLR